MDMPASFAVTTGSKELAYSAPGTTNGYYSNRASDWPHGRTRLQLFSDAAP